MSMVLGTDKEIAPLLDEWSMHLAERGIDVKGKTMPISPRAQQMYVSGRTNRTEVPIPVVERQCRTAFEEAERRIKADQNCMYYQGHHVTKEPLKFYINKKYPSGMPWVPAKEDGDKANNGRLTFIMLLKEDQKPRMRQIFKDLKDTNVLANHLCRNV